MTFNEIMEAVKLAAQDTEWGSENPAELKWKVNQAYSQIAEETTIVIPQLKTVAVVPTTTDAYATMPSGFSRMLLIVPEDGVPEDLKILKGLEDLVALYPSLDEVGDVQYVALEGNILWYQGIPSTAQNLVCVYGKTPTQLVNTGDIPSIIPDHLHYGLLVNKTVELIYKEIEDGIEGDKVNTMRFRGYYAEALNDFNKYLIRRRGSLGSSAWDC